MVYYLKYRSQNIDELDSKELRDTLNNIFLSNIKKEKGTEHILLDSIPHAFLFTGPKGLGKTSTARIVAKVVNCTQLKLEDKHIILCKNKCEQCKTIAKGTNLDVIEIDGASNRGIDEVRDLRDKVRLAPVAAHRKIYIIDEVHMLTPEAFNALLKTIEEPPAHVMFIFCTTEAHKVPNTIISRCFNVNFHIATQEELVRSFERIVKGENLKVDKDALNLIAGMSDGSFRDGVKILEELSLQNKQITKQLNKKKYKTVSIPIYKSEMIESLVNYDVKKALKITLLLSQNGIDFRYFIQQLLEELHSVILTKLEIQKTSGDISLSIDDIKILVDVLSKAYLEVKLAPIHSLPLELAIIDWCTRDQEIPINNSLVSKKEKTEVVKNEESKQAQDEPLSSKQIMDELISKVKMVNQSLAGVLRGCEIKTFDGKALILETKYKFHKDRLDDKLSLTLIKNMIDEITAKNISVSIMLRENL